MRYAIGNIGILQILVGQGWLGHKFSQPSDVYEQQRLVGLSNNVIRT